MSEAKSDLSQLLGALNQENVGKISKRAQIFKEKTLLSCDIKVNHLITDGDVRCVIAAIMELSTYVVRCNCGWKGNETECPVKHFGAWCGESNDYNTWGWEEWDDFACPKCGKAVDYESA